MNLFEIQILDWIQNHIASPFLDTVMPLITRLGDKGIFMIILALTLLIIPKTRKIGAAMSFALIIDVLIVNLIMKNLIARTRPFDVNLAAQLLISKPHDFSFPSGHSGATFAVAGSLVFCKNKFGPFAMVVAALIALSRLYLYAHYPTDVLGGICIGLLSGYLGTRIMERITQKKVPCFGSYL